MAKKDVLRAIGILGTIALAIIFIRHPTWPTPDKIVLFLTFVFLIFGAATSMLKRLLPLIVLLLVYESFRGFADDLNTHVNFTFMPAFDVWLFGALPTAALQQWWWHGYVQWYDFAFYLAYMLHFIIPIALVLAVWRYKSAMYTRVITAYVVLSFAGFITYAVFPAAPPWMASEMGYIQPIERVSSSVWAALGIQDFPSVYSKISPNAVAAVPSLHAAYATLFSIFIFALWGKKWGALSLVYPLLIYFGTVYQGEHYVFDALLGALYGGAAYLAAGWLCAKVFPRLKTQAKAAWRRFQKARAPQ